MAKLIASFAANELAIGCHFFEQFERLGDVFVVSSLEADKEQAIAQSWEDVESRWEEDDAHRKFIALCDSLGRLDSAGTRYKAVVAEKSTRSESAQKRIDQLLTVAMKNLEVLRTPSEKPPLLKWIMRGVIILLFLAFVVMISRLAL